MRCLPKDAILKKVIDDDGVNIGWYFRNGFHHRSHSFNDQPSYRSEDYLQWAKYDRLHRGYNKPATVSSYGTKQWYINGDIIRLQKSDGTIHYYDE